MLQVLAARVLGPGSTIPPPVRADLFSDLALQQLAQLSASHSSTTTASGVEADVAGTTAGKHRKRTRQEEGVASEEGSQEESEGEADDEDGAVQTAEATSLPVSQAAAYAAHEVLVSLLTDPAQGVVTPPLPLDTPLMLPHTGKGNFAATVAPGQSGGALRLRSGLYPQSWGSGDTEGGGIPVSGAKRILRLLPRLRPIECMLHMALLEATAHAQPVLVAEYLSTTTLQLEPQVSTWQASAG